jgi:hypothetical protein
MSLPTPIDRFLASLRTGNGPIAVGATRVAYAAAIAALTFMATASDPAIAGPTISDIANPGHDVFNPDVSAKGDENRAQRAPSDADVPAVGQPEPFALLPWGASPDAGTIFDGLEPDDRNDDLLLEFGFPSGIEEGVPLPQTPGGGRIRDLTRIFLNVGGGSDANAAGDASATNAAQTRGRRVAARQSLLETALDSLATDDIVQMVSGIIRPTVEPDGMVSFSVPGFGNYMLVRTRNNATLDIVDLETGSVFRMARPLATPPPVAQGNWRPPSAAPPRQDFNQPYRPPRVERRSTTTLSERLISFASRFGGLLVSPLFIVLVVFGIVLWVVVSVRSRGKA